MQDHKTTRTPLIFNFSLNYRISTMSQNVLHIRHPASGFTYIHVNILHLCTHWTKHSITVYLHWHSTGLLPYCWSVTKAALSGPCHSVVESQWASSQLWVSIWSMHENIKPEEEDGEEEVNENWWIISRSQLFWGTNPWKASFFYLLQKWHEYFRK